MTDQVIGMGAIVVFVLVVFLGGFVIYQGSKDGPAAPDLGKSESAGSAAPTRPQSNPTTPFRVELTHDVEFRPVLPAPRFDTDPRVTEHAPFPLSGTKGCEAAIAAMAAWIEEHETFPDVVISADPEKDGAQLVHDQSGRLLGRITARHKVSQVIAEGNAVLYAMVNSADAEGERIGIRIRVATGPAGANVHVPRIEPRWYPVQLVGEQHYQAAIRRCEVGMAVELLCEPDNPYDAQAIVAALPDGATLGYVPRDSFLQRAVHEEGKGAFVTIGEVVAGRRGFLEIVLQVRLNGRGLGERAFTRS